VGQAETPGAPPGHRPDPTPTAPPAFYVYTLHHNPNRPGSGTGGKEQTGTSQCVDQHGGGCPELWSSPPGASHKQTSSFPSPPRPPALGALPSSRPWVHRVSLRRHCYCRSAVGNRRPSAPTPMPITGTAAPGTGPGVSPGRGVGAYQQQSDPSMAPEILSYGRRPPPPSDLGWPVASPSPSCDNQPPTTPLSSPPGAPWQCRTIEERAASPLGPLCPLGPHRSHNVRCIMDRPRPFALTAHGHRPGGSRLPATAAPGPPHLSPSSGPWRQTRRRDSYPPGINMFRMEIFSKNHFR
jgi:hypothetical protein